MKIAIVCSGGIPAKYGGFEIKRYGCVPAHEASNSSLHR